MTCPSVRLPWFRTSNSKVATLNWSTAGGPDLFVISPVDAAGAPINYGALSWDAKRGVLWGGRYLPNAGVPGGVDTIPPAAGVQAVTAQFAFAFPPGESCYASSPGFIDGLSYDEGPTAADGDDSLWLSDDAATVVHHVDLLGASMYPDSRAFRGEGGLGTAAR